MYVTRFGYTYYDGSNQRHTRAPFLILASDRDHKLYGCIRKVALSQVGHFMMGSAVIAGERLVISGAYGSDGLPLDYDRLPQTVRSRFLPVPAEIAAVYWKGDGWNSSGGEAPVMRDWARQLMKVKAK